MVIANTSLSRRCRYLLTCVPLVVVVGFSPASAQAACNAQAKKHCDTGLENKTFTILNNTTVHTGNMIEWRVAYDIMPTCTNETKQLVLLNTSGTRFPLGSVGDTAGSGSLPDGTYHFDLTHMANGCYNVAYGIDATFRVDPADSTMFSADFKSPPAPPNTVRRTFHILWPFPCPLTIDTVTSDEKTHFSIPTFQRTISGNDDPGGGIGTFDVLFTAKLPAGDFPATITIIGHNTVGGCMSERDVSISTSVTVNGSIPHVPSTDGPPSPLEFVKPVVVGGPSSSMSFSIASTGTETIHINASVRDTTHFTVSPTIADISPGTTKGFDVTFKPGTTPIDPIESTLDITRNMGLSSFMVMLKGHVLAETTISISPANAVLVLDRSKVCFDPSNPDLTEIRVSFTISATGPEPIKIDALTQDDLPGPDPALTIVGKPLMGETVPLSFVLRYEPVVTGRPGTLNCVTPPASFTVTGTRQETMTRTSATATINITQIDLATTVPTLSEWGRIIMFLLLSASGLSFVLLRHPRPAFSSSFGLSGLVGIHLGRAFDLRTFSKVLALTWGVILIGAGATWIFGSITALDLAGSLICGAILAFIAHLFILGGKQKRFRR